MVGRRPMVLDPDLAAEHIPEPVNMAIQDSSLSPDVRSCHNGIYLNFGMLGMIQALKY